MRYGNHTQVATFNGVNMSVDNSFQLSTAAAESYENQKVPAIFAPLAKATLEAIALPENGAIIDLACGTGIIPRLLTEHLPGKGRIVGSDLNPAMIEVARRTMPETGHSVDWIASDVADLPCGDDEFDMAFVQQGLQFFPERPAAMAEIHRVLAPGGKLVLTVWSSISPFFQAVSDSLKQRVSETAAKQAVGPFSFRDGDVISSLLGDTGFTDIAATRLLIHRPISPVRSATRAEMLASVYEKELRAKGDAVIEAVIDDAIGVLEEYRDGDCLMIPQETHLFQAVKP